INVELPTEEGLAKLAPEKRADGIRGAMGELRWRIDENTEARKAARTVKTGPRRRLPRFAPAGQSTQLIVGADGADDGVILRTSNALYGDFRMRRVYYSAFSPIPDASAQLPPRAPPLQRDSRLDQADGLMRFCGFGGEEIVPPAAADGTGASMLDLDIDPKLAWALRHPRHFPVDLNSAPRVMLLRVPGLGTRNVDRLVSG